MQGLIVGVLQQLAKWLDKAVPLNGGRTVLTGALAIISAVTGYLTGSISGEMAATAILLAIQGIYASLHKN